ncbi:MAG TPA: hypothetical protein VJ970_05380 [Flavobacteriaceae bacterium]|nr:hypothetical protein [Flavobacteriaceae bacterium]
MELVNIEQLLEKYFNATTTSAEEKQLKNYFSSNNVAPHLQQYQAMFGYFTNSKQEKYSKTIQLKTKKSNWKWLSVAASLVLLVSVYSGYYNHQQRKAEEIYLQSMVHFEMLSENFNKGEVAFNQLQRLENTANKIYKQPK